MLSERLLAPSTEISMSYSLGDVPPLTDQTVRSAVSSLTKPLIGAICALWLVALPLQAAETAADEGTALQEVVVTGSRIPVPANIGATSPITAVSAQDIKLQGQSDVIDVLNALPQNIIESAADL